MRSLFFFGSDRSCCTRSMGGASLALHKLYRRPGAIRSSGRSPSSAQGPLYVLLSFSMSAAGGGGFAPRDEQTPNIPNSQSILHACSRRRNTYSFCKEQGGEQNYNGGGGGGGQSQECSRAPLQPRDLAATQRACTVGWEKENTLRYFFACSQRSTVFLFTIVHFRYRIGRGDKNSRIPRKVSQGERSDKLGTVSL